MRSTDIIWLMASGACFMIGAIHALAWCCDRARLVCVLFSFVSLSIGAFALVELNLMHARTPSEYLELHRLGNVLMCGALIAVVPFVQSYFGTGRIWLAWSLVGIRCAVVVATFVPGPSFHFREVSELVPGVFLGDPIVIPKGVSHPWAWVAEASTLLLFIYIVDAAVRLWRTGDATGRNRAVIVGSGAALFVSIGVTNALLVRTGHSSIPYAVTLAFLPFLGAIGSQVSSDIARTARVGERLRESAEAMKLAAEAARLAHWRWDIPRDTVWGTDVGRGLYGIAQGDPVDLRRFLDTVHPGDVQAVREAVGRALAGEGPYHASYRVRLPDGRIRWIEARARVEFTGGAPSRMLGVSMDITERKDADDRFRLAVEASPNGVLLSDEGGAVLLANRRAETLLGYGVGELHGTDIRAVLPGVFSGGAAEPEAGGTFRVGRKDGTNFPAEIGVAKIDRQDGRLALTTIVDLTARMEVEAEARRLRDELAHLTRVAALSELSGSLAHEFNHTLGIILSNAQAAQRYLSQSPPDLKIVREVLSDIVEEDLRASRVVRDLRQLTHRGGSEMGPVTLNEVAGQILRLLHHILAEREVSVRTDLAPGLGRVEGDRSQLEQVVLNLILNAVEAMAETPVAGRILLVATRDRQDHVRFTVEDRGCGLPAETEALFRPFHTTKTHGLGMGLAICRSIVEAHGGRIWAEPNPGGGASFHVELPHFQEAPA